MKEAFENLARAKGYYHRHDILRTMASFAQALKQGASGQLFGADKMRFNGQVTEIVQLLNRTDEIRSALPEGLQYESGGEKKLFMTVVTRLKKLQEEAARLTEKEIEARKLNIDKLFLRGNKQLQANNPKDALESFKEAASLYVDEHVLFTLIGTRLLDAGLHKPALGYLSKAVEVDDGNENAHLALARARIALNEPDQALAGLQSAWKQLGHPTVELAVLLAQAAQKAGKDAVAKAAAAKAQEMDPLSSKVKKLLKQLR